MTTSALPPGVSLSHLSEQVFEVLARYTTFPWPVLSTQCKRLGLDPAFLTSADLRRLIPLLTAGVARFTSPLKGEQARRELENLAR